MPAPTATQIALTRERRTNRRLRALIAELRATTEVNRRDLDLQFARLAQMQAEIDALTRSGKPLRDA